MTTVQPAPHRIRRRIVRTLLAVVLVIVLVVVVFLAWANTVMGGDREAALEVWTNDAIEVAETEHSFVLAPTGDRSGEGLVFIPGAKVDPFAYARTLAGVVEDAGVTVVITKPTLNLAFFDTRPLSTFTADAPDVDAWAVGGHSLGGVRACQLADGDPSVDVTGLVFFGSYCANDISASAIDVLSISGTADGLTTPEDVESAAPLLPADTTFVEIEGGNHADFGDYGVQPGDGESTIPRDDARAAITDALVGFFD
ncbi:alpha/beta hydrolase family protein [Labedella gwakjiensis]|uniref:Alpha/beta hydrolase n=1 Tax=Labedella gwakjiensis TaxID=390269 RepID=A0A2P8GZC7_9MICO|nr:alpha/beta hydrolase [Labedella gwakjiensis]PSL39324.1 alpha/beta hydrolase family protein [Labedella gwakjiensis]RUQ86257.1 alpha/beta hydrolase [Labedella gwakjiensis]